MYQPSLYTVESVTSGHPDKVCDQISDAILDALLAQDPTSRVAVETFGSHGHLVIGGEVSSNAQVDYAAIARKVYSDIGYTEPLDITVHVVQQSPDIAMGVNTGGAGDQGIMYGFATNENEEMMPTGVVFAHKLAKGLELLRRNNPNFSWVKPDGKSQVTMRRRNVQSVVVSTQHDANTDHATITTELTKHLIAPIIGDLSNIDVFINPTGQFIQGGFAADAGLTGRKIMVDTYGGYIQHGGGAFSGKDSTKVDRSAAYMARLAAKSAVAAGLGNQILVSVAYAIGRAEPVMVEAVDERGNSVRDWVIKNFDFRPLAIIERLGLRNPIFLQTAAYGHFGKPELPWEQVSTPTQAAATPVEMGEVVMVA